MPLTVTDRETVAVEEIERATGKSWNADWQGRRVYLSPKRADDDDDDGEDEDEDEDDGSSAYCVIDFNSDESPGRQLSNELRRVAKWYLKAAQQCDFVNGFNPQSDQAMTMNHLELIGRLLEGIKRTQSELDQLDEVAYHLECDTLTVPNSLAPTGKLPIMILENGKVAEIVHLDDPREAWCDGFNTKHSAASQNGDGESGPGKTAIPGVIIGTA